MRVTMNDNPRHATADSMEAVCHIEAAGSPVCGAHAIVVPALMTVMVLVIGVAAFPEESDTL